MGKTLVVLILTVGILLGGFYLFFYQNGESVLVSSDQEVSTGIENETTETTEVKLAELDTSQWLDYQYMTTRLVFTTKYPATLWQSVEQLHENEFNLIFTNGDSCQVVYSFDLEAEAYNFDLVDNQQDELCAKTLQKIIAYASVPKFGIAAASLYQNNLAANEPKEETAVEENEAIDSAATSDKSDFDLSKEEDSVSEDKTEENSSDEDKEEKVEDNTVIELAQPSAGVSDQEIMEMSATERYTMVKEFVHEYLMEFAKRHWDYVLSKLSAKAKKELGSASLSSVVNTYYYYEVLNVVKEISPTQYTTTVKLTNKEEEPIGEGSGVYKLNIVWENGEWKMDNYLFE